jgi:tRNA nucleotidyltransferase (CCA-adding enzyme)
LMFEILRQSGLMQKLLPELKAVPESLAGSVAARFALLTWPLEEAQITALCERLRAPNEVRELALTACRSRNKLGNPTPEGLLDLFKTADAFRRPERFAELLEVAQCANRAIDKARIERVLRAAAAVNGGAIAAKASSPDQIPTLLDAARLRAIAEAK